MKPSDIDNLDCVVCENFVARLVRNDLPTGFLYGSPKPVFAQTVPKDF
jgi:hypothetical protein